MTRTTIDYGIDLGTTNSSIALRQSNEVEVFKNNEGWEYTPSAVWLDKHSAIRVGRRAKECLESDPDNAYAEFKLQMGTADEKVFARSDRRMKPEELSAEVLKALKADVRQRNGEDVEAAVITVPAAFELPQCDATKRAAQLAGISYSPLLQEPVAAALAYGVRSASDKVFWLTYDLGGGTFDAAVIQLRGGAFQVVNHGGDNHLGGKLIDWTIVEELLMPTVLKEHPLTEFRRGHPKWRGAITKLKLHAEQAKIRLSRDESAEILIDYLCNDDRGEPVRFEYEMRRTDVERLAEPFIVRSINICKKVLKEKRLEPGHIEKILLVGGPTLTPYLRQRLADRSEGLGIPLEFSIDPLTVVARGAAIFASSQALSRPAAAPVAKGRFSVELHYKPVGSDHEPLVGGKVLAAEGESVSGFTIEFVNLEAQPLWRSGNVELASDGTFMTSLWAEKGRLNTFRIALRDGTGTQREVTPDQLAYRIEVTITEIPLIHSIGVAMADNKMDRLLEKGAPLPARKRTIHRTTEDVRKGQQGAAIRIPLVEGDNEKRADRNRLIGMLEIPAAELTRDVPAGSEIEITIDIDQSRLVRAKAYIPLLDEEFEKEIAWDKKQTDPTDLGEDFKKEKQRLEQARSKAAQIVDPKARQALDRIDKERMLHDVESALAGAQADRDAADKCQNRLLDLKIAIDEVEDALQWPVLLEEVRSMQTKSEQIVNRLGRPADQNMLESLRRELAAAIEIRDTDLAQRKINEINSVAARLLQAQPEFWVQCFDFLQRHQAQMRDPSQGQLLISRGGRAIQNNEFEELESVCRQLAGLLPPEFQRRPWEVGRGGDLGGGTQRYEQR